MKRLFILLFFAFNALFLFPQKVLTIEGTVVNNTETGTWNGVGIPRDVPTKFTYRNNAITSVNFNNYMLMAGDEGVGNSNNNLDGEIISGNQLTWNGTDMTSICHGIFTGHNINAIIRYNYLNKVPMGIIRKSNGMTDLSGAVAYNIIKSPNVGIVVKGMNGIKIYNNTFYQERTTSETNRGLIDIYQNSDITPAGTATGTKIFNNIFYTKHQTYNINVYNNECLSGFESDYNVFWCEDGSPLFKVAGSVKTFAQWQALGYDKHSVVVNPNFINTTNLVPDTRLNYGTNLGAAWQSGLSTDAIWGKTDPKITVQNGTWQVGSRIYAGTNGIPNQAATGIRIYPDPVTGGILNVKFADGIHEQFDLSIFDLSGKLLLRKHYKPANLLSIDISAYPPAQYLIQIQSVNFRVSDKFTIR